MRGRFTLDLREISSDNYDRQYGIEKRRTPTAANQKMKFLKNAWYPAAWDNEISGGLLARTFLDQPVLLFRKRDGTPVALSDRCPPRFAPLHLGRLIEDKVECPYHGLVFDCRGTCVGNPHGDGRIPRAAQLRCYPTLERYGVIWLWMGEPNSADPARLPVFDQIESQDKATIRGYVTVQANYELLSDNLLDLSHAQFVHAQYLRTDELLRAPHEVSQRGDTVVSRRWAANARGPASFMRYFEEPETLVDVWMRVRWDPPGLCRLDVGVTPAGRPESEGMRREGSHLLAPETETSTHYFYANTRNYLLHDSTCDEHVREWHRVGFGEQDKPMVEAVQKMMSTADLGSLRPVLLYVDSAAVRARKVLAKLIHDETSLPA